jgi:putative SOS response-associated peptidase YedK
MCGRMKSPEDWSEIRIRLQLASDELGDYASRYNVAPTTPVPVVTSRSRGRTLQQMRWGLIPAWSKGDRPTFATFNARGDTVANKPAFRSAWRAGRRCLVLAGGFYEWRAGDKQPFFVALHDLAAMAFGGLWEERVSRDGEVQRSCTIITTEANALMSTIHDRMPLILPADRWASWLGEEPSHDPASLIAQYPAERMTAWAVNRRVGNVANDDPTLTEPLATF